MKIIFFLFVFMGLALLLPVLAHAQPTLEVSQDEVLEAKVLEILEEKEIINEDGSKIQQQNIKLRGLNDKWRNKEFIFYGISDFEVLSANAYKKGDKVLASAGKNIQGDDVFYIIDYIRRGHLYLLTFIFAAVIILIGRWKGLRALLSLIVSFLVIIKFIVPRILAGADPLTIGIIGSSIILILIIYITEGFSKKSHLAIFTVLICLFFTSWLSSVFTSLTKLTGLVHEEAMFLISGGYGNINFKGLLLTAILIGTLGILDDVVISQMEAVEQIRKANPKLAKKKIFKMAYKVGNSHLGAVVNTLFLAYVGASLPLLLLFSLKQPPFLNFSQVINSEIIATEIVRTLVGSISLALAVPVATVLGVYCSKDGS